MLSGAGLRLGSGRVPNSSSVFALGVAVKATYVTPSSLARSSIWAASKSSVLNSPPSANSSTSSGESTRFSLAAASPACELCASSAITANRFPSVAASSRTALIAKGNVWIVQTMIFLPLESAVASSPLLLPPSPWRPFP
jgi:hypothetical protein